MKLLNGLELAGFIQERQARQVRALRQAHNTIPRLAIVRSGGSQVTDTYLRLKKSYGEEILVEVDIYNLSDNELINKIQALNQDDSVHGIIVQLPLTDIESTDEVIGSVKPEKDVDGLTKKSPFIPATARAIDWLINGYGIDLNNQRIAVVGDGRLVGRPLYKLWHDAKLDVTLCDESTNLDQILPEMDIIVSAVGKPRLIKSDMLRPKAVIVDAGTASESGKILGDVDEEVRARDDLTITPKVGGVGPLTIAALFDNLIEAVQKTIQY